MQNNGHNLADIANKRPVMWQCEFKLKDFPVWHMFCYNAEQVYIPNCRMLTVGSSFRLIFSLTNSTWGKM